LECLYLVWRCLFCPLLWNKNIKRVAVCHVFYFTCEIKARRARLRAASA
jgi:hypothetical protein